MKKLNPVGFVEPGVAGRFAAYRSQPALYASIAGEFQMLVRYVSLTRAAS
jgi:hypothetical protein